MREGYRVTVTFLWLPSVGMAVAHVKNRIKQGGHSIPENVVRRRFHRGLANLLNLYLPLCHSGIVLDSTRIAKKGEFRPKIAEKLDDKLIIHDTDAWNTLLSEAQYG